MKADCQLPQSGAEVTDGIVTVSASEGSYAAKWGAERAAQRVSGF